MQRLTVLSARHPRLTLALLGLLCVLAARLALQLEVVVGNEAWVGAEDPELVRLEAFQERFGGGDPVLIAFECFEAAGCDDVFSNPALRMAHDVARSLERAPHVLRVASPATSPLLVASASGDLEARGFVRDGVPVRDAALVRLALSDPMWSRTLVSEDAKVGAIVVELASTGSAAFPVVEAIRRAIAPFQQGGFRFHLVGEPMLRVTVHEATTTSAVRVGAATGALLFLTLLALLRSWHAVAASLASVGVAALFTVAALPLLGWPLSDLGSSAATLVLVIGSADCIHFVSRYLELLPGAASREAALGEAARAVSAPCIMTTATTALAFLCFGLGGVEALTRFGALAALGVTLALGLTFSLLPALLALSPKTLRSHEFSSAWQTALARLAQLAVRRRRAVLACSAILALAGALGIPRLRIDLGMAELLGEENALIRAAHFVSKHLMESGRFELELALPEGASVADPGALAQLARFQDSLLGVEGVVGARSVVTLLRHANRLLRSREVGAALPDSEPAIGELLTLISLGDEGALDPWLTLDQRSAHISVEARAPLAEQRRETLDQIAALGGQLPVGWGFAITGPSLVTDRFIAALARSQSSIVSASSLLVFGLLALYLRSLRLAVLALVPNAAALLVLFGGMGLLGIPFTTACIVVTPIALGLATDDTIHFLTHYGASLRAGLAPAPAIRRAIATVGESVIATSLALALGFLAMRSSPMPSVADIGLLSALAILGGGVADLVVLPALIAAVGSRRAPGASGRSGRERRAA